MTRILLALLLALSAFGCATAGEWPPVGPFDWELKRGREREARKRYEAYYYQTDRNQTRYCYHTDTWSEWNTHTGSEIQCGEFRIGHTNAAVFNCYPDGVCMATVSFDWRELESFPLQVDGTDYRCVPDLYAGPSRGGGLIAYCAAAPQSPAAAQTQANLPPSP